MRLAFDRPPPVSFVGDFDRKFYDHDDLRSVFVMWLRLHDIFIEDSRKGMRLLYNDFYHVYDIEIFERPEVREPRAHFDKIRALLKDSGWNYEDQGLSTWRYEPESGPSKDKKMVMGLKLWIYTKPKEARRHPCCAKVVR